MTAALQAVELDRFTDADAWVLGVLAVETARERGLVISIDIRRGEHQLFHAGLPGTSANNDVWIERKVNTTRRFARSSLQVRLDLEAAGQVVGPEIGLDPLRFVAGGGCVPVLVSGVGPVATVTVSGLSDVEDHEYVVEMLGLLRARSE